MSYRYYRYSIGGGLLLYMRADIPTKLLKYDFGTNIENLSVEINFQKRSGFSMALTIHIKRKFRII